MAAAVESMVHFGEMPWHGESIPGRDAYDIESTIVDAGLNWPVGLEALYTSSVLQDILAGRTPTPVSHKALYRVKDGVKQVLDIVGPGYTPLQNAAAFAWFQPWLDARSVKLEAAGSLEGGQRTWVLGRLDIDPVDIVPGDRIDPFILLANPHKFGHSIHVGFTPVRVVCRNTLRMAVADKASQLIRVTHTQKVERNLRSIRDTMNIATRQFIANAEQYKRLAATGISKQDVRKFVKQVLRVEEDTPTVEKIMRCIEAGKGHELAPGTLWNAYNGVTEYLSWEAKKTVDSRTTSLWFGGGSTLSQRALDMAIAMAV